MRIARSRRRKNSAAEIATAGGRAAVVAADLAIHEDVMGLVAAAAGEVGPLTLLVNNASVFEPDGIGYLDRARFDLHYAVNVRAPVFLAEAFAAQAAALPDGTDASIVNLLDQRIYKSTPNYLSYGLAKNALYAATTTLAQALAPRVRVNAIAPGPALPNTRQDAETFARLSRAMPLGRGPSPEEIAEAVLYPRRRPQRDRPDHRGRRRPALELARRSGEQRLDRKRAPASDSHHGAHRAALRCDMQKKNLDPEIELKDDEEEPSLPDLPDDGGVEIEFGRQPRPRARRHRRGGAPCAFGAGRLPHDRRRRRRALRRQGEEPQEAHPRLCAADRPRHPHRPHGRGDGAASSSSRPRPRPRRCCSRRT